MKRAAYKVCISMAAIFLAAMLVLYSCKKEPASPTGSNKILIGATIPDTVSYVFAKVSTQLNGTGGNDITQHGHCWSFESNPDISDAHSELGSISNPGNFSSDLSGLSDNKRYYVRPYFITIQGGTIYGIQKDFTTPDFKISKVNTTAITNITSNSALSGGNVIFDGGAPVTARGVCWSTSPNPTLANSYTTDGNGMGSFVSNIIGLSQNTLYYVRAYAINSAGTSYGNEVSFNNSFYIGNTYGGGIIFHIDNTGLHGLVVAASDQSTTAPWGCLSTIIGVTHSSIGTGQENTTAIVNGCSETGTAARICYDLVLNGYEDWFLPSKDELYQIYLHRSVIGGFVNSDYWSSTEYSANTTWAQSFDNGSQYSVMKNNTTYVRAVRAF